MIVQWLLACGLCFFVVRVLGWLGSAPSFARDLRRLSRASRGARRRRRNPDGPAATWGKFTKKKIVTRKHSHDHNCNYSAERNSVNVAEWWDFADERMSGVRQLSPDDRFRGGVFEARFPRAALPVAVGAAWRGLGEEE